MALRGTYVLVMQVNSSFKLVVGGLGEKEFSRGCYVYVGSAMNNLPRRVERHIRKDKRRRWHIDYLTTLKQVEVKEVWVLKEKRKEKEIGKELLSLANGYVKGFGSSDSPLPSHLFYFPSYTSFLCALKKLKEKFKGLAPYGL